MTATSTAPKKRTVFKPIEKRCRSCGESWKYGPTKRHCTLCGGVLDAVSKP
jgi:rRNA maturation endonuclease Nob1